LVPHARRADLTTEHAAFLTHGRGVDTTRMRQLLGFEPSATTASAFDDFARRLGAGVLDPARLEELEQQLSSFLAKAVPDGRR
jgi:UDP-glucose 4-epimerase